MSMQLETYIAVRRPVHRIYAPIDFQNFRRSDQFGRVQQSHGTATVSAPCVRVGGHKVVRQEEWRIEAVDFTGGKKTPFKDGEAADFKRFLTANLGDFIEQTLIEKACE